jgi:hypothetical protein
VDFVIGQGIEIQFNESIAPALGVSYGGKIALLPGQSTAEEFSTLVHELAHSTQLEVTAWVTFHRANSANGPTDSGST